MQNKKLSYLFLFISLLMGMGLITLGTVNIQQAHEIRSLKSELIQLNTANKDISAELDNIETQLHIDKESVQD